MNKGQLVCLKSDTSKKGVVMDIEDDIIHVFMDGCEKTYFAMQLLDASNAEEEAEDYSQPNDFNLYMIATQLQHQNNNSILSLNTGKIDFIPYQYRPVLKFIKSDQPRILIADSVGVGKTIEAELILKELEARQEIESVAIICPKPLISEKKWENELRRFGEDFEPLDGTKLRTCINQLDIEGTWPTKYNKCIIPYSIFDKELLFGKKEKGKIAKKGLLDLDPPPHFDLIIVDEAHHIKNTSTSRYQIVKYFMQNSTAAIFLTATPVEIDSTNLFVLLNLLRPDLFLDVATFKKMLEPNKYINLATVEIRKKNPGWNKRAFSYLKNAAATIWGSGTLAKNPDLDNILSKLAYDDISDSDRVRLITQIEQLNSFSNVINRTRRRDIGNFTIRRSNTIRTRFTKEQQDFYDTLLDVEEQILTYIHGNMNVAFMMNMLQRQAASCIHGMAPLIDDILKRNVAKLLEEFYEVEDSSLDKILSSVKDLFIPLKQKAALLPDTDYKLEELITLLHEKDKEKNNKVIIFSTFRHTLSYLNEKLSANNFRVAVIHGGVPDEERRSLRQQFMLDKSDNNALDILLFSEVGCEGLDYQFCNYMINYDLPWNPMKIEQRIGRIDRNGQKNEFVTIVNMITEDTVEQVIYDRCLNRIGIFENSIGDSEEILGEISEQIESIVNNKSLSKDEIEEKLQQMSDNEVREIQENERLENEQHNLLGININKQDFNKELDEATNKWLSSEKIRLLIKNYLENAGINADKLEDNKDVYSLRLSRDQKDKLLEDFKNLNLKQSSDTVKWSKWLKGTDQYINIAFENSEKVNDNKCTLISIQHPLIKQAMSCVNISKKKYVHIKTKNNELQGEHYFMIVEWIYTGVTNKNKLVVICDDDDLDSIILDELYSCSNFYLGQAPKHSNWDILKAKHKDRYTKELDEYNQNTQKIIGFKAHSLETSIKSQIILATQQLEQVTDANIIKMREKEIENLQNEKLRKLSELEELKNKADINFNVLVYGIIE